eukprot:7845175-Ditylum_brightwellii.AAC.1
MGSGAVAKGPSTFMCTIFFIKDRVDSGEVKISHCGTGDMAADYFTKPLQGAQFRKFRKMILNFKE